MATKQVLVKEDDPLKKKFQILEEDWNSYKNSISRHRRTISDGHDNKTLNLIGSALMESSPEKLISSLQRFQRDHRRTKKIEGRNLMEELESAKIDDGGDVSPICSVCSSVLIQEVKGDRNDDDDGVKSLSCSYGSDSSSDSDISVDSLNREVEEKARRSGEERWVVRMIWFLVAVWMVVVGIILAMAVIGDEGKVLDYVTPT